MTETKDIPVDKLHADPASVRPNFTPEFVNKIRGEEIIQPVIVRPHGDGYGIFIGARRFVAAKKAGFEEVPCTIRKDLEGNDEKVEELSLLAHTSHKPLPRYRVCEFVLERYRKTDGRKTVSKRVKEVAERLNFSRTTVYNYLRVGNLDSTLRARLKEPSAQSEEEKESLSELIGEEGSDFRKIGVSVAGKLGDSPFFLELQEKNLAKAHKLATEAAEAGQQRVGEVLVKWKNTLANNSKGGENHD